MKFTEHGEITLEAALESQGPSAATVRFTITDTGIGISEEVVAVLFSPFTQADAPFVSWRPQAAGNPHARLRMAIRVGLADAMTF